MSAASDTRVTFGSQGERRSRAIGDRLIVWLVGVEGPFADVAVHVEEAPRVGLLFTDGLIGEVGVVDIPGVFVELAGVVAKGVGGGGAGAAGVFPFGFGRETVVVAGLEGEPFTELGGGVLGHRDGGVFGIVTGVVSHIKVHRHVGRSGLGDGVDEFWITGKGRLGRHDVTVEIQGAVLVAGSAIFHEGTVESPSGFGGGHPEGFDLNFTLGPFVVGAVCFAVGRAEGQGAAGDGDEVELCAIGFRDGLGVGFHLAGMRLNESVDFFSKREDVFLWIGDLSEDGHGPFGGGCGDIFQCFFWLFGRVGFAFAAGDGEKGERENGKSF